MSAIIHYVFVPLFLTLASISSHCCVGTLLHKRRLSHYENSTTFSVVTFFFFCMLFFILTPCPTLAVIFFLPRGESTDFYDSH